MEPTNNLFAVSLGDIVGWLLAPFGALFLAITAFGLGLVGVELEGLNA